MDFKIANYKVSTKTSDLLLDNVVDILEERNIPFKIHNNFIVFKTINFTFSLFKSNKELINHINITKIKNREDIRDAISIIECYFDRKISEYKIDNIIASSKV